MNLAKLEEFMKQIGQRSTSAGTIYLTGGSTALLLGIRDQTVDIDIKLDPEPDGAFEAIAELKVSLSVNVELASPDLFIPQLPAWRERCPLIGLYGKVQFRHFDFYSQALAKIERGHEHDVSDVEAYLKRGMIDLDRLSVFATEIAGSMKRYPALDPDVFQRKVRAFIETHLSD